jgi:hypothetical protein
MTKEATNTLNCFYSENSLAPAQTDALRFNNLSAAVQTGGVVDGFTGE